MTAKKDFKRRVRERQAKTGESYTAARANVLAHADTIDEEPRANPIAVVELVDATEEAHGLGLKCAVLVSPDLAARIPPLRMLERLRDALLATEADPQMHLMRAALFRGEPPKREPRSVRIRWDDVARFYDRARVGIGGLADAGDMLALQVDDTMVIVQLGHVPHMVPIPRPQLRVFLTTVDAYRIEGGVLYTR
jgi:hypothetical protein